MRTIHYKPCLLGKSFYWKMRNDVSFLLAWNTLISPCRSTISTSTTTETEKVVGHFSWYEIFWKDPADDKHFHPLMPSRPPALRGGWAHIENKSQLTYYYTLRQRLSTMCYQLTKKKMPPSKNCQSTMKCRLPMIPLLDKATFDLINSGGQTEKKPQLKPHKQSVHPIRPKMPWKE